MLKLMDFKKVEIGHSKLRTFNGGAELTKQGTSKNYSDIITNDEKTKYDCDPTMYNDGCGPYV